jgi:hypothetical protein
LYGVQRRNSPGHAQHDAEARDQADQRRQDDERTDAQEPDGDDRDSVPALRHRGAGKAADQRVRRRRRGVPTTR